MGMNEPEFLAGSYCERIASVRSMQWLGGVFCDSADAEALHRDCEGALDFAQVAALG